VLPAVNDAPALLLVLPLANQLPYDVSVCRGNGRDEVTVAAIFGHRKIAATSQPCVKRVLGEEPRARRRRPRYHGTDADRLCFHSALVHLEGCKTPVARLFSAGFSPAADRGIADSALRIARACFINRFGLTTGTYV